MSVVGQERSFSIPTSLYQDWQRRDRGGSFLIKQLQMFVDDEVHKNCFQILRIMDDCLSDNPQKHENPPRVGG